MTDQRPSFTMFRERLLARERMLGTFLKLPTTQVVEMLGPLGYDFVVIDQEHAPLDRGITDLMILAARASNIAPLVRIAEFSAATILSALDCGAMGIMVPHVNSVEKAEAVAQSCRYAGGTRGFAGLTRASTWGSVAGAQHMKAQDRQVACIVMIEDQDAIEHAEAIARVDGVDALFIGRGDLTASFGNDPDAGSKVAEISRKVAAAAREAGVPLLMLPTTRDDFEFAKGLGASALLLSSDHGFIRSAAAKTIKDFSD
ncbi:MULTISPECIES: HpcH/HpaI aldolase family protein [Neorhizobium]|uniref:HpcH/HpaI aldolase family protein n=1 Tax=Neorhizobium TaxID=1525371 RepID=UPI001FE0BA3B|nr:MULTISPECIES: aldolase/citrate lyase family protein [Neorhizobium]